MRLHSSPWGPVQDQRIVADGIVCVSTAGHGGYWVSDERRAKMTAEARGFSTFAGSPNWYEEDSDWAIVAASFPADFPAFSVYNATRQILKDVSYFGDLTVHPGWMMPALKIGDAWVLEHADHYITGSQSYGANGYVYRGYRVRDEALAILHWPRESCKSWQLPAAWTLDEARALGAEITTAELAGVRS